MKLASATASLRRGATVVATLLACMGVGATAASAFTRGFVDDVWFTQTPAGDATWIAKTKATEAKIVQIEVDWAGLEPNAPTSLSSTRSASSSAYDFSYLDARVKEIVGSGLQPVFLITDAPRWAEGSGGTAADYATGGYEPNAIAFGDLGQALAKRYSGTYPDPSRPGRRLPRVRYMQAWGEANMNVHLSPQWSRVNGHVVNSGAIIYRGMLNAFYRGVKAGDRSTVVLASGFEAYGDAPFQGLQRTHPVTFLENMLCLDGKLKRTVCPGGPAHFDVVTSDPYDSFSPTTHAVSNLDASAPDLGRLTRVVRAGLKAGTLLPRRRKPLWVTEFGYDSNPPNRMPGTVSTATQARWLEQGFYVFWHEGVSVAMWYLVRDQTPPYATNYFSGVYFRNGRPKPSYTAYRFPFVVMPDGKVTQVWGITPVNGAVSVQVKVGGGWRTLRTFRRRAGSIFKYTSSTLARGSYRAQASGGQRSLVWKY